jgi:hypothetical protein
MRWREVERILVGQEMLASGNAKVRQLASVSAIGGNEHGITGHTMARKI